MTASNNPDPPLAGVRVLELSHDVSGPYCGRLLADFGASVLKLEPPLGDPGRRLPPFLSVADSAPVSLLYLYLNQGKSVLTLDLDTPEGRARTLQLACDADVVVENFAPGTLSGVGLGWHDLHEVNPRLILTSITGFGQTGPYGNFKSSDIVADALGGLAYVFGYGDREPLTHPNSQAQYRAGTYAASATLAALLNLDGRGEHVDISTMECVTAALRETIPHYTFMGAIRRRSAIRQGSFGDVVSCADGYVIPTVWGAGDWSTLARFLEAPEMDDERFATGEGRERYAPEIAAILAQHLVQRTKLEFFHSSHAWGIGAGIVLTPEEVTASDQLAARGYFHITPVPGHAGLPFPRGPFVL